MSDLSRVALVEWKAFSRVIINRELVLKRISVVVFVGFFAKINNQVL